MLSVWSSENAVIWISGVGHRIPIASPGWYSYAQPQPQPCSRQSHSSPPSAQPANSAGPTPSTHTCDAVYGALPAFCGSTTCERRNSNAGASWPTFAVGFSR
jgi:hypothetical protein